MPTRIDNLFYELDLRKQGFDKALADTQRQLRRMGQNTGVAASRLTVMERQMRRVSRATSRIGRSFRGLIATLGGFFVLRGISRSMTEFEQTVAEIATIAPGGTQQINELRSAVIALSRSVPQSADELGAGAYQILSSGISETSDVLQILEASSKAAVGGLTDTATAVDAITTIINAYGLSASDAVRVSDVLFETVRLGKLRFDDIASSIGKAVTSASLAGVSIEELTAAMATMTLVGVDTQEATTSLNRLFLTLVNQTDEQAKAFDRLGIEFNRATVEEKGFAGLLEEVNELSEGQLETLAELFPNIRAARSAFVLAGDSLDDYRHVLNQTIGAQGSAQRAFEEVNQSARNQFRLLKNNLNAIFLEISTSTLPTASSAMGFLAQQVKDTTLEMKVLGAGAAVLFQTLDVVVERIANSIRRLLRDAIREIAGFAERVGTALSAAGVPAGSALRGLAGVFENLGDSIDESVGRNERRIESMEKLLEHLKLARDEVNKSSLAESDFAAQLREHEEAIRARIKALEDEANAQAKAAEEDQKRASVLSELADRVSDVTLSAAEQQIKAVDELERRYVDAFGEIGEEAEKQFGVVREAAEEALRVERAERLAESFREAIEAAFRDITLETAGLPGAEREEERRRRQIEVLEEVQERAAQLLKTAALTTEEEEALRDVLAEIVKLLERARGTQEDIGEDAKRDAEERLRDLERTLGLIDRSVRGALELAEAFGLVNEETADTIRNLEQIGSGIAELAVAIPSGNPAGIIAGALQVIGGIAGLVSGDDAEEEALRRQLENNRQALRELTASLDRLRGTFDISGIDFARVRGAIDRAFDVGGGLTGAFDLFLNLHRLGLSMEELDRVANELGITIRDEAGRIIPEAIAQLRDALEEVEDALVGFPFTVQGVLRRLQAEFELLDVTDPVDQLRRLQEELENVGKVGIPALEELLGIDVSTAEGRQRAEQLIEQLFRDLAAGRIAPEALGAATFEEAIDILRQMEGLLDEIQEDTEGQTGQTQDVRRSVQVTEVQANAILARMDTGLQLGRDRNQLLQDILATLGGAQSGIQPPAVGPVTNNIDIVIGDITINAADATSGQELAQAFTEEVDRALGEKLIQQQRLLGLN